MERWGRCMVPWVKMVFVAGDFGVRFQRFRARHCSSVTVPVRVKREKLRDAIGSCGGAETALVTWRAWTSKALT